MTPCHAVSTRRASVTAWSMFILLLGTYLSPSSAGRVNSPPPRPPRPPAGTLPPSSGQHYGHVIWRVFVDVFLVDGNNA